MKKDEMSALREEILIEDRKSSTHIYLIGADNGLVNIGISSDVEKSFRRFDAMSPMPLFLMTSFRVENTEDARDVEVELHTRFAEKRVRGVWFILSEDEIQWIFDKYDIKSYTFSGSFW